MKHNIKVSVLIPVYGVEKYIERCARSLFEQTMKEGIEFIFTNDCTKDRSIEILNEVLAEYPNRQSQVRIINHDTNQGLAVARVTGVKAASGEYVIHCDSDDWVEPNMYELMYAKAKETDADIVGCDFIKVCLQINKVIRQNFNLPQDKLVGEMIRIGRIDGYLWNRLIRRSFYLSGGYIAPPRTTLFEDMAITVPMHMATTRVSYVPHALYYYRCTDNSSMSAKLSETNLRSAVNVLYSLHLNTSMDIWKIELLKRLKVFLFARAVSISERNISKWKQYEYNFLLEHRIPLNTYEKCTMWLINHNYLKFQYSIVLLDKLISPKSIINAWQRWIMDNKKFQKR